MKKPATLFLFSAILCSDITAQQPDCRVLFPKNISEPGAEGTEQIIDWIEQHPEWVNETILLRGHTDSDGSNAFNTALSAKRNEEVKRILVAKGFTQVRCEPYGETWPLQSGNDELSKSANRRVDIMVMDSEEEKFAQDQILPAPQIFECKTSTQIFINGLHGTVITIPANSIVDENGMAVASARVELREFYNLSDCLAAHLSTTSNGRLLETGGMIEIRAFDGDKELNLAVGSAMEIVFATQKDSLKQGMQIFNGTIEEGIMNWVAAVESPKEMLMDTVSISANGFPELVRMINRNLVQGTEFVITDSIVGVWNNNRIAAEGYAPTNGLLGNTLTSMKFGWINCDRFALMPSTKLRDIVVDMKDLKPGGSNYLVFESGKSVMNGYWSNNGKSNTVIFNNVPAEMKCTVVCHRTNSDGEHQFAKHEVLPRMENISVEMMAMSEDEVKAALLALD